MHVDDMVLLWFFNMLDCISIIGLTIPIYSLPIQRFSRNELAALLLFHDIFGCGIRSYFSGVEKLADL